MGNSLRARLVFAILQGVQESDVTKDTPLNPPSKEVGRKSTIDFNAWQLAWELGYTIAIPIVIFALLGRWADKAWGTSPWLLLAGIVVSIMISSFAVYRKVKNILK